MTMSQANHVGGLFGRINQTGYTSKTARMPSSRKSFLQADVKKGGAWMLSPEQRENIHRREVREAALVRNERKINGLILPKGVTLADW